jgi:tetratricopeptide (TPR) repeat protein
VYTLMERLPGSIPARKTLIATTLEFLEKLSKEAGGNTQLRIALAKAYLRLGDLQGDPDAANMGDKDGSLRSYRAGLALLEGAGQPPVAGHEALMLRLGLQHKTGGLLRERGQENEARRILLGTLAVIKDLPVAEAGRQDVQRLKGLVYITTARAEHPQYEVSEPYAKQAIDTFDELLKKYPNDADLLYGLSMAHTELGYVLLYLGRLPDAAVHYERSTVLREKLVEDHPGDALFRRSLMLAYDHYVTLMGRHRWPGMDRPEVARVYAQKALALAEATAGDPDNLVALSDYATMLVDLHTLEVKRDGLPQSLAGLRHAASIFETLRSSDRHLDGRLAFTYVSIAQRLEAMGRKDEALAEYRLAAETAATYLPLYPSDWEALQAKAGAAEGIARLAG